MKSLSGSILAEDTAEMIGWRMMSQLDMDECWKKTAGKIEEEVLNYYNEEDSKRGAYRGKGMPPEWRRVRRSKKYRMRKWCEDCWARIFTWFREYKL